MAQESATESHDVVCDERDRSSVVVRDSGYSVRYGEAHILERKLGELEISAATQYQDSRLAIAWRQRLMVGLAE